MDDVMNGAMDDATVRSVVGVRGIVHGRRHGIVQDDTMDDDMHTCP